MSAAEESLAAHRNIYMLTTQETVGILKIGVEVNKSKKITEQDRMLRGNIYLSV